MSFIRKTTTTALIAATALTGVASAADAPVVSQQSFIAGAAPVTFPGTGVEQGEWMGSKSVAVYREVTLEGKQTARLTLKAPQGKKIRALGMPKNTGIGLKAASGYVGRSSVTVTVFVGRGGGTEQTARVHALVR